MTKKSNLLLAVFGGSLFLAACGDDVTKTTYVTNEISGLEIVASADSLGKCSDEIFGEMKFASKENAVYVCSDSSWKNVSAVENVSCFVESLKDSSGYKIVCGGDSVGVVLNGKDGKKGEAGEDGVDGSDGAKGDAGKDGAGCLLTDNGDGSVIQVCGADSVTLYKAFCGGKSYDPDSSFFCYADSLYEKCGGKIYDPSSSKECFGNRLFETFKDNRDGQVYRMVQFGEQTWMAENLNYAYMPDTSSFCSNDSVEYCKAYGRLYRWWAALEVCPDGWHLPSDAEWDTLKTFVAKQIGNTDSIGYALKLTTGWKGNGNGSDAFGFGALPGGCRESNGAYDDVLDKAYFWSSTSPGECCAYYRGLFYDNSYFYRYNYKKDNAYSIRCVKD